MEDHAEAVPRVFGALTLSTIARRFGRLTYSSRGIKRALREP
jgi:hypothetical protein